MTTTQKIWKAINNTRHDSTPYVTSIDDQTSESIQSYSGLVEDVENELEHEGFIGDIPQCVVDDYVDQMI